MVKEHVVYTYNGILFSLKKKEGNSAIWDNVDKRKVKTLRNLHVKWLPASGYASAPPLGMLPSSDCGWVLVPFPLLQNSGSCWAPQWKSLRKSFQSSASRPQLKADGSWQAFLAAETGRAASQAATLCCGTQRLPDVLHQVQDDIWARWGWFSSSPGTPAVTPLRFPSNLSYLLYFIFFSPSMRIYIK